MSQICVCVRHLDSDQEQLFHAGDRAAADQLIASALAIGKQLDLKVSCHLISLPEADHDEVRYFLTEVAMEEDEGNLFEADECVVNLGVPAPTQSPRPGFGGFSPGCIL